MSSSNSTKTIIAACEQSTPVALRIKNLEQFMSERQTQKGAEKDHTTNVTGSKCSTKVRNALLAGKLTQEEIVSRKDRRTGDLSNANKEACPSNLGPTWYVNKLKTIEHSNVGKIISEDTNRFRDSKKLKPENNCKPEEVSQSETSLQPVDGTQVATKREWLVAKASKTPPPTPMKANRPTLGQVSVEGSLNQMTKRTPPKLPSKLNRPRLRGEDQVENSEQLPLVEMSLDGSVPEEGSRLLPPPPPPAGETKDQSTIVFSSDVSQYQNVDVIPAGSVCRGQLSADQEETENTTEVKNMIGSTASPVAGTSPKTANTDEGVATPPQQVKQVSGVGSGKKGMEKIKRPLAPPPGVPQQADVLTSRPAVCLDGVHAFMESRLPSFDEYVFGDEYDDDETDWDEDEFDDYDDTLERSIGTENDASNDKRLLSLKYETLCKRRKHVVQELFSTEVKYVNKLYLLNKTALQIEGANMCLEMFDCRCVKVMFPCVENLYRLHSEHILPALRTIMDEWSNGSSISHLWEKYLPFLTMYTTYTRLHDNAMDTLRKLKGSCQRFDLLMHKIEEQPEFGNLSLSDHMLEPIQRLSRYKLLLQNYTKHLKNGDEERTKMTAIIETVSQLLDDCENQIRND